MPDHLGADQRKVKDDEKEEKEIKCEIQLKSQKFIYMSLMCHLIIVFINVIYYS